MKAPLSSEYASTTFCLDSIDQSREADRTASYFQQSYAVGKARRSMHISGCFVARNKLQEVNLVPLSSSYYMYKTIDELKAQSLIAREISITDEQGDTVTTTHRKPDQMSNNTSLSEQDHKKFDEKTSLYKF